MSEVDLSELLAGCEFRPKDVTKWLQQFLRDWVVETKSPRSFVFRGQKDARWPIESSLTRRARALHRGADLELVQSELERAIMIDSYQRGLPWWEGSRKSYLLQLAYLQHYGAPTRLVDVTSDINVALYFACEDDSVDGRLFAFSAAGTKPGQQRHLTEEKDGRSWVERYTCPWRKLPDEKWRERSYLWQPAHIDRRMFAQQGGFLFGGVPARGARVATWRGRKTQSKKIPGTSSIYVDWTPANPQQWQGRGRTHDYLAMTIVIPREHKATIRKTLASVHGITHHRLFPDFVGVAYSVDEIVGRLKK